MGRETGAQLGGTFSAFARDPTVRRAVVAYVVIVGLYAVWIPVIAGQTRQVQEDYWILPVHGWTVPNYWFDLFFPSDRLVRDKLEVAVVCAWLVTILLGLVIQGRAGEWLIFLLAVVPVFCALTVSLVVAPIIHTRYFLFAHVFVLAAAASVIWRWFPPVVRNGLVVSLLCGGLYVHWGYWSELKIAERPGLHGAVEHVLAHRPSNEPLIVVHPSIFHAVRYYSRAVVEPKLFVNGQPLRYYKGEPIVKPNDFIARDQLQRLPDQRIWVLDTTGFNTGYQRFELPSPWRKISNSQVVFPEVFGFQGRVSAAIYERSSAVGAISASNKTVDKP
jgi:hypothetical protein